MTDAERIVKARRLLVEITLALDCAETGLEVGSVVVLEAALLAAMGAAEAVGRVLGGTYFPVDKLPGLGVQSPHGNQDSTQGGLASGAPDLRQVR